MYSTSQHFGILTLVWQMYGAILMMSGAYCLATESHVRGDVIYRLFKPRTQGWIDLVLYFIFFFPGVIALAFLWSRVCSACLEN